MNDQYQFRRENSLANEYICEEPVNTIPLVKETGQAPVATLDTVEVIATPATASELHIPVIQEPHPWGPVSTDAEPLQPDATQPWNHATPRINPWEPAPVEMESMKPAMAELEPVKPVVAELETRDPVVTETPPLKQIAATPLAANGGMPDMLLASEETQHFRARWNEVQAKFVDEPSSSVHEADELVNELMTSVSLKLANERRMLENQWKQGDVSTENLRQVLQSYRSFFNRLLK